MMKGTLELGVQVGWDPLMSAQGMQYIEANRAMEPSWIICKEGNNHTSVTVNVNQSAELEILENVVHQ